MQQITINKKIEISGIGLHSGKIVNLRLLPAGVNQGIVFKRVDIKDDSKNIIPARYDLVTDTRLCTMLSNKHGISVGTIEHLMSALASFLIDNVIIEVDAPEIPILDGSAIEYIKAIDAVGLDYLMASKKIIKILKPVELSNEKWKVRLEPNEDFVLDVSIDFSDDVIGAQNAKFNVVEDDYNKIAAARTFCFLKDIEYLKSVGLALGGSLDNAIVVDKDGILNAEGLRMENEFARHKLLDAMGDLYLSGYYIKGKFIGNKCGHASNNEILRALFKDKSAYSIEEDTTSYGMSLIMQPKNHVIRN